MRITPLVRLSFVDVEVMQDIVGSIVVVAIMFSHE